MERNDVLPFVGKMVKATIGQPGSPIQYDYVGQLAAWDPIGDEDGNFIIGQTAMFVPEGCLNGSPAPLSAHEIKSIEEMVV